MNCWRCGRYALPYYGAVWCTGCGTVERPMTAEEYAERRAISGRRTERTTTRIPGPGNSVWRRS